MERKDTHTGTQTGIRTETLEWLEQALGARLTLPVPLKGKASHPVPPDNLGAMRGTEIRDTIPSLELYKNA